MTHRQVLAVLAALTLLLCAIPCSAKIVYVKWDSPGPTFNGKTWTTAYHTVQEGANTAISGDEVWVARGTYVQCIYVKAGIALYGGFAGTETARGQRDFGRNETVLAGTGSTTTGVLRFASGATGTTRIDGFTVTKGNSQIKGAIDCTSASPTITNNTITGNVGPGVFSDASPTITNNLITGNTHDGEGGGIWCHGVSSAPTITGNTITGNSCTGNGGGIASYGSSAIVADNTVISNTAGNSGGGIFASGTITGNKVLANTGSQGGGGIDCISGTVADNLIVGNACPASNGSGGGVKVSNTAVVTNNTIVYNSATSGGGGVECFGISTAPTVANNIVAFNSSGISDISAPYNPTAHPLLRNNCVYGNTAYNYSGISAGTGDIAADPLLADTAYSNFHIQPTSPCRNAGWNAAPGLPSIDMDGQARVQDTTVDIGADESNGTLWTAGPYAIIRVSPEGSDWNDGSSWAHAKKTVRSGVALASVLGGEVWVKAGTYTGPVHLSPYAHLYGGFAGTETLKSERDWVANRSVLDGAGVVVSTIYGEPRLSTLDGFSIRNSSIGVSGGGANIANNTISGMTEAAISCESGTITNNRIEACGSGIFCAGSAMTVTNNTIVRNSNGITCGYSYTPTISNNIVAFNKSGILNHYGIPTLWNNCVYGNTDYNYSGLSAGTGDISADPLLVDTTYRNLHIQPASPCRNAGLNSAPGLPSADMDNELRVQDGTVDIGADESDGTTWAVGPYVIVRVSPSGNDANDGSSWTLAKRTVQAAADAASILGGDVWVKAGTYNERISCSSHTYLYGGFAGTESARSERNPAANPTVLDGGAVDSVVAVARGLNTTAIDGFTIRNGKNHGIYCSGASPMIANNIIIGNAGSGVYCISSSSPTITNNRITGNRASAGGGVYCDSSSPIIRNNTITGNSASNTGAGGAIHSNSSSLAIANNTIVYNGSPSAGAICMWLPGPSGPSTIVNNIVAFNSSGIYNSGGSPVLRNNCLFGNTTYAYSGVSAGTGDISTNPLMADARYGNFHIHATSPCRNVGDDSAVLAGSLDMDSQARIQGTHVDIGADESDGSPWTGGPYVTVRVSPSGDDSNDGSSWSLAKRTVQEAAYTAAIRGGEVWVKAGTYNERINVPPYADVYGGFAGTESVRTERNWGINQTILDGQAGGSVVTLSGGYTNRLSAIDGFTIRNGSAARGGGIQCVNSSPGIANNTITGCSASEYGGGIFCTYSSPTIENNVVTGNNAPTNGCGGIYSEYGSTFYITNNTISNNQSTGVSLANSSAPYITRNTISGNTNGGILCASSSAPTIGSNLITGNSASLGAGISCSGSSPVNIANNTIVGNNASSGGGGIYTSYVTTNISNNIVAFNSSGIYKIGGTATLRNNDVFGNTSYGYSGLSAGTGDISVDPLFVNRTGGNYHLTATSPCKNVGLNSATGIPSIDIDGESRIRDTTVDIGADEYSPIVATLSAAKSAANGTQVALHGFTVSAAYIGSFYLEADDKSCGIRVNMNAHGLSAGMKANVAGTLSTTTEGERCITTASAAPSGTGLIEPILLPNKSVGGGDCFYNPTTGAGQRGLKGLIDLNNIGLLVSTTGKVTYVGTSFFYLDDGSKLNDGSGYIGVRVNRESQTLPTLNSYVKVIGASSCYKRTPDLFRLIRASKIIQVTP